MNLVSPRALVVGVVAGLAGSAVAAVPLALSMFGAAKAPGLLGALPWAGLLAVVPAVVAPLVAARHAARAATTPADGAARGALAAFTAAVVLCTLLVGLLRGVAVGPAGAFIAG